MEIAPATTDKRINNIVSSYVRLKYVHFQLTSFFTFKQNFAVFDRFALLSCGAPGSHFNRFLYMCIIAIVVVVVTVLTNEEYTGNTTFLWYLYKINGSQRVHYNSELCLYGKDDCKQVLLQIKEEKEIWCIFSIVIKCLC